MAIKQEALKRAQTSSPDYKREAGKAIPATYKNILEAPLGTLMQQTTTGKLWTLTQKDKDYIKNMLNGEKARPAAEQQRGEALKDAQGYSVPSEPQTTTPIPPAHGMSGLEARVTELERQMAELLSQRPTAPATAITPTPTPVPVTSAPVTSAPVTSAPTAPTAPTAAPTSSHPDLWTIPNSIASITPMLQNNW